VTFKKEKIKTAKKSRENYCPVGINKIMVRKGNISKGDKT